MKASVRRIVFFFLICMILATLVSAATFFSLVFSPQEYVPPPVTRESLAVIEETQQGGTQQTEKPSETSVPRELNLAMDFYTQAPFGNWDYPWQEACEEATILLIANEYYGHEWTRAQFNEEILDLVDWQMERFGHYEHTDMHETSLMLRKQLGLDAIIHEDPSLEDIQRILAKGHFIVFPADGKVLENHNFSNGGPIYHVFVVKGYTADDKIITHDVGTRNGSDYVYTWEVLDEAFHDYAEPMSEGKRQLLEVLPPAL